MATAPSVSIPRVSGVTSRSNTSSTSPLRTPPWIAAPMATTSSGLTPLFASLPKNCFTFCWMRGILVCPPTKITSSIWAAVLSASANAWRQGSIVLSTSSVINCSSLARFRVKLRCLGPLASAVIKGRLISVCRTVDSSIFAFSAASLIRCRAILSCWRSIPWSFLNSSHTQSIIFWSKSSPPRWVSPAVDLTWKVPSPSSSIEISKVPPPRS